MCFKLQRNLLSMRKWNTYWTVNCQSKRASNVLLNCYFLKIDSRGTSVFSREYGMLNRSLPEEEIKISQISQISKAMKNAGFLLKKTADIFLRYVTTWQLNTCFI